MEELYIAMGVDKPNIDIRDIFSDLQGIKKHLDEWIKPENMNPHSSIMSNHYHLLNQQFTEKVRELSAFQKKRNEIKKNLAEEKQFSDSMLSYSKEKKISLARSICPFCYAEQNSLIQSATQLEQSIDKLNSNIEKIKPMKYQLKAALLQVERDIGISSEEVISIKGKLIQIKNSEEGLALI